MKRLPTSKLFPNSDAERCNFGKYYPGEWCYLAVTMKISIFTDHPASIGESYVGHLRSAMGFAAAMIGAGLACFVHALVPALFTRTGSEVVERLHQRMVVNRGKPRPGKTGK